MTVRHRPRALLPAIVAVTLLGACGAEDSVSSPPLSAGEPAGLRPPVAVSAVSAGGGWSAVGDVDRMSAESASSSDMSMMPAFGGFTYVAGEGLPSLPTSSTAFQYPPGAGVDEATVATLAEALGVGAGLERVDDETTGLLWRAGPDDGTAPSLNVSRDPQLSWYYSGAWAGQTVSVACAEVVEADGTVSSSATAVTSLVGGDAVADDAVGGGTDPCMAPEPPTGVPTSAEAEAESVRLLTAMGEDPAAYELETYADAWFASVTAWPSLDGVRSPMSWGFGFGADARLEWANGSLADPVPAGPYPIVDLDGALARLAEQSSPSIMVRGGPVVDVVEPAAPSASASGSAGSSGSATATASDEPATEVIVADPPIAVEPPAPGSEPAAPAEPEVATLVDVRADFWWIWDADGSVWLLPAYTFTDTEDRQHTVPAVTDEFLIVTEPTATEPPAGEPATSVLAVPMVPTSTPTDPLSSAPMVDPAVVVGLTVDEAAKLLAGLGLTMRVVREDGVDLAVTEDFSEARVNVAVESNIVTSVVSFG